MGTSNVYIINQEVAWVSWDNKKYCKFNGNMPISHKENKDYAYKPNSQKIKVLVNQNLNYGKLHQINKKRVLIMALFFVV